MQDFIEMAAAQLGARPDTVQTATGGLLGALKEQAGAGAFDSVLGGVPGLADLVSGAAPDPEPAAGGGLLGALGGGGAGGLLGAALGGGGGGGGGGLLGAALGGGSKGALLSAALDAVDGDTGIAQLVGAVAGSGLSTDQVGPLAQLLVGFLGDRVDAEQLQGLLRHAPAVLALLKK